MQIQFDISLLGLVVHAGLVDFLIVRSIQLG